MIKNVTNKILEAKCKAYYIFGKVTGKRLYSVLIDITNSCNLRCIFCTRNNSKVMRMETEDFKSIMNKVHKHVKALQLSCAWEYSIARNAAEIIKILGDYRVPFTSIYTNGNILTDDVAEAVVDARINDFVISIGESKKETYEKIRRGGNFDKVFANIDKINCVKKRRSSDYPRICSNLTLINSNIGELLEFVQLAHEHGINEIRGRHLILNEGLPMDGEIIRDKNAVNELIDNAYQKAVDYGIKLSIPKYSDEMTKKRCRAPLSQLYISSNGDVSICPRIHMYENIGNLIKDDLQSILGSTKLEDIKNQISAKVFKNPVCGICIENRESENPINQGF